MIQQTHKTYHPTGLKLGDCRGGNSGSICWTESSLSAFLRKECCPLPSYRPTRHLQTGWQRHLPGIWNAEHRSPQEGSGLALCFLDLLSTKEQWQESHWGVQGQGRETGTVICTASKDGDLLLSRKSGKQNKTKAASQPEVSLELDDEETD